MWEFIRMMLGIPAEQSPTKPANPADESETRDVLRQTLLDSYQEAYEVSAKIWGSLETKSQGNITIAGIFIAGVFAFIKDLRGSMSIAEKSILAAAVCLLIASVFLSMLSLLVRKNAAPPYGTQLDEMISPLLELTDDELKERVPCLMNDRIAVWREVLDRAQLIAGKKARFLLCSQICLWVAVAAVAVLTIVQVFH